MRTPFDSATKNAGDLGMSRPLDFRHAASEIYRYMSFDKIAEFRDVETVTV